jgi:Na+-driven multidrug efflux pump
LIYGSQFDGSVALGFILLPGIVVNGLTQIVNPISSARGFVRYPLFVRLLTTPVAVGLYFLLIPSLEETGAALASTLVYLCIVALSVLFFRRSTGIRAREALIPGQAELRDYRAALARAREYVRDRRARSGR